MNYYVTVDEDGFVVGGHTSTYPLQDLEPNQFEVETYPSLSSAEQWIYQEGELINLGERPSPMHKMNRATKQWEANHDHAWGVIRKQRDSLLASTDWRALRANELGEPLPKDWKDYRKALRDITKQADPMNIVWPTVPAN